MKRRKIFAIALAPLAAMALSACNETAEPTEKTDKVISNQNANLMEIVAKGHGLTVGQMMAANTVYVLFDATCPHCARLWKESKALHGRAKFVWIPVGLLPNGAQHGATILAASDPVAAMEANEAAMSAGHQAAPLASSPSAEALDWISANTEIFKKVGTSGVPTIVYRNAATGIVSAETGFVPADELARMIGV